MRDLLQKGFTLVEMLTVLGIFSVMTSIVVFNYGKFTSDTILTNMAYEVALSIREAQIYGVSVRNPASPGSTPSFSVPYGVHFPKGSSTYFLFADRINAGGGDQPDGVLNQVNCTNSAECVTPYTLQRGIKISDVSKGCGSSLNKLDITFVRPNPEAKFDNSYNVTVGQIELSAPNGSKRYVVVRNNGQIFVDKEPVSCS